MAVLVAVMGAGDGDGDESDGKEEDLKQIFKMLLSEVNSPLAAWTNNRAQILDRSVVVVSPSSSDKS